MYSMEKKENDTLKAVVVFLFFGGAALGTISGLFGWETVGILSVLAMIVSVIMLFLGMLFNK